MAKLADLPSKLKLWEPEESVGLLWDAVVDRDDGRSPHHDAGVTLEEMSSRLAVLFRGLSDGLAVEIKEAFKTDRRDPRSPAARASFDGETLRLPALIAWSPRRDLNEGFYLWLTAASALSEAPTPLPADPLQADLVTLRRCRGLTAATLEVCPGLVDLYQGLAAACLTIRPPSRLFGAEAAVEAIIRSLLDPGTEMRTAPMVQRLTTLVRNPTAPLDDLRAPRGYRPRPLPPIWPERLPLPPRAVPSDRAHTKEESGGEAAEKNGLFRAKRRKSDQAERKDGLLLHRFETFLSWAEFLNLNRRVDDDDEDTAKKAADDHDHLSLATSRSPAKTKLKLHLDLAPEDVDRERLSGEHLYPEWDHRQNCYWPDHCRVLTSLLDASETPLELSRDAAAKRRIRAVKRRFEALRPRRIILPRQPDGDELDLDAAVRARADFRASGETSERLYRATRTAERDLAVAILIDSSRSTESVVGARSVIEIAREALTALAWGLEACGDASAIFAFSSLKRDRVYLQTCKTFDETMGPRVEARIGQLRPTFYTRLGAAVRHVSQELQARARSRRLLLILTDGKPNDLDHYEGRYGVEDSRKAVQEARRLGQSVFGVTIDSKSRDHFGRMFGPGGFAIVRRPDKLTEALPKLYRHLVQG